MYKIIDSILLIGLFLLLLLGVPAVSLILWTLEKIRLKEIDCSGDGDLALIFIGGIPTGAVLWIVFIYELVKHIRIV